MSAGEPYWRIHHVTECLIQKTLGMALVEPARHRVLSHRQRGIFFELRIYVLPEHQIHIWTQYGMLMISKTHEGDDGKVQTVQIFLPILELGKCWLTSRKLHQKHCRFCKTSWSCNLLNSVLKWPWWNFHICLFSASFLGLQRLLSHWQPSFLRTMTSAHWVFLIFLKATLLHQVRFFPL